MDTPAATTRTLAPTDGALLGLFLDQHDSAGQAAFTQLVQRHAAMVLAVCRSVLRSQADAEDAAQATFLTLARKAPSLRPYPSLAGWLHRVAWFAASHTRRAEMARQRHEREAARMNPTTTPSEAHVPTDLVHESLAGLPEKYRLPMVLHYIEHRGADEVAALLGISPGALAVRLTRGRQRLCRRLTPAMRGASALSMTAVLTATGAPASAVPAAFVATATQTAASALAGQIVTGSIFSLSQGAIHMLFMAKMKLAAVVTAAVMLAGGTGVLTYEAVARAVNRDPNPEAHAAKLEDLPATLKDMTLDARMLYLKRYAQQFKPREGVAVQRSANGAVEVAVAADNTPIKLWRPTGTVLSVVVAGDGTTSTLQAREGGEVHLAAMPPSGDVYALGGDGSPVGANGGAGGGAGGVVRAGTKPCYDPPFDRFQDVDMNKANPRHGGGRGMAVAFFAVNPVPATQVRPEAPEELARKEAIDEIRRQLATGRAGHKLPDSFKVEIELDAVGRSVGLREHWVFTPTTVSRLAHVKRGEKWVQEPAATNEFTKIKEVCDALWNGEFLQLAGTGEWISGLGGHGPFFFGTPFIGGERMITVSVGDRKLTLGRNCWRATRDNDTDRESRFAGLYNSIKGLAPNPNAAIAAAMAQGVKTGVVPAGFHVVIETFGSKADSEKREGLDKIVSEAWRFTPAKIETFTANTVAKSREVNVMKAVCRALVAAGFMTLAEAPRGKPFAGALTFDTIACKYGWRYVRVSLDNQTLYLGEGTTWPAFTDAKQAEQARDLYIALRKIAQAE
jgi:RNA polymerase sigma factor (sigma-70 family)